MSNVIKEVMRILGPEKTQSALRGEASTTRYPSAKVEKLVAESTDTIVKEGVRGLQAGLLVGLSKVLGKLLSPDNGEPVQQVYLPPAQTVQPAKVIEAEFVKVQPQEPVTRIKAVASELLQQVGRMLLPPPK